MDLVNIIKLIFEYGGIPPTEIPSPILSPNLTGGGITK